MTLVEPTRSCATELVCRDCGRHLPLLDTTFRCLGCGQGLDIDYDYELATKRLAELPTSARQVNIWRFEELLPIVDARAQSRVGINSGRTPLIHAERLGAELGLRKLYLKDDSTQRPSLSYKDRVVSMAIARLLELGKTEIGCVSTGNVGTSVSSLAAKAGVNAYVFYPSNMERGKARACRALGAAVCQLDGNYDDANRACRELALASGIQFANITLRPFYAEGAKTVAFEVVEQLDWRSPEHLVMPAAGGTLSSRVHKGLVELERVGLAETAGTKIHVGQADGCDPVVEAIVEIGRAHV
jgi:threonine synthase